MAPEVIRYQPDKGRDPGPRHSRIRCWISNRGLTGRRKMFAATLVVVSHLLCLSSELSVVNVSNLAPVVLVPGDGGSRLEAKLDKPSIVQYNCDRKTKDYYTLWLDVQGLLPYAIACWADNMKLNYDEASGRTENQPGVDVRVADFGDPKTLEYLDPRARPLVGGYMNHIIEGLVSMGYIRSRNLFGAPYDFRKGPSELGEFFGNLTSLIENTYEANGKKRVVVIGHSMGCLLALIFLRNQPKGWKDTYVRSFISLAGAYGGTMKAVKIFAAGDDLGVGFVKDGELKQVLSSMPSTAFLMPNEDIWDDEVVVSTLSKNYTVKDMEEFFNDIEYPIGWKMLQNERPFLNDLGPPEVEVYCLYGYGVTTIKQLIYRSNSFPDNPLFIYENGDGTVNLRSLKMCQSWVTNQEDKVYLESFEKTTHMGIVEDENVISYIQVLLTYWSNV